MIDWSKYFDHIFCIHYLANDRVNRHHQLINELSRVGIYQSGIFSFIYDEDSVITNDIMENARNKYFIGLDKYGKRVTINHYKAFNIAKICGYKNILVLEDDVCFLKDLDELEKYIQETSILNTDLIMYDYITYKNIYTNTELNCFATCYQLKNDGIDKMIKNLEHIHMYIIDLYFSTTNHYNFYAKDYEQPIVYPHVLSISKCPKRLALQRNNPAYKNCHIDINYDEYENFFYKT